MSQRAIAPDEAMALPKEADHYRAYVGPPERFGLSSLSQFALLFQLGLREQHPEMVMIGHHDPRAMERLRDAAAKKGRTVRIVDQKTVVVPLHEPTLADPLKLLASVRSLLERD